MKDEKKSFFTISLDELIPEIELSFNLYLFINRHFILFRNAGAILENDTYTRLQLQKIEYLFIEECERESYSKYKRKLELDIDALDEEITSSPLGELHGSIADNILKAFTHEPLEKHIDYITDIACDSAKELVNILHAKPYSTKLIARLTLHSHGIYGHSVNVSTLAIHFALMIGLNQKRTLELIGSAGLLHDIGKLKIDPILLDKGKMKKNGESEKKILHRHPELGRDLLLSASHTPEEIRLMVYQHHENYDGSGYPDGIEGFKIYELTKFISIANVMDHLFHEMKARGQFSVKKLIELMRSKNLYSRFDPRILEKVLGILEEMG